MKESTKELLHEGIDTVGGSLINLLPVNGYIRNALDFGLDAGTDLVFDGKVDKNVPLSEHSELKELAANLVPIIKTLIHQKILAPIDFPFVEGENEELFEQGLLLQVEALLRQAIQDLFDKKKQA